MYINININIYIYMYVHIGPFGQVRGRRLPLHAPTLGGKRLKSPKRPKSRKRLPQRPVK